MNSFDRVKSFGGELCDQTAILDRLVLAHCASDGDSFRVYQDDSLSKSMRSHFWRFGKREKISLGLTLTPL